ncbi:MAG: cobalt ECF transporter T component CbiQ [Actinomycetia bacterium]|nr:cobalt ECF transporter T component CbiQ [Actinomycetes bacterium]
MITAILTMVFSWCLFSGQLPDSLLVPLCVLLGVLIAFVSRYGHSQSLSVDVLAQMSRLRTVNPMLKFWILFILMIVCIASANVYTGLFLLVAMLVMAVFVGGLPLSRYIRVLALPVSFLMIGGLALLFEISPSSMGVLNIPVPVFGFWLSVSAETQARTALVVAHALGAVSCLCLISLSTPMPDIISVLRRMRCPSVVIDLMYLIYRYIFILLTLHREMRVAAQSRLGFRSYRTSLRATGMIYSNLLARSYQFASKNYDAMESRCCDTGIRFLERPNRISLTHAMVAAALLAAALVLCFLPL